MAVRCGGRALAALVLAAACSSAGSQRVSITSVSPSRGSLAGGTRMVIKGQGFSTNTGGEEPNARVRGLSAARGTTHSPVEHVIRPHDVPFVLWRRLTGCVDRRQVRVRNCDPAQHGQSNRVQDEASP
jgi:hypothetical protein